MGCRKLDIRSQFYFVRADEKPHTCEGTADYTKKTAYSRFFHTVISNYRYYSPELGRWLSRDPIYIRGTTAWLKFNREDIIRRQIERLNSKLTFLSFLKGSRLFSFMPTLVNAMCEDLIKTRNYLEFRLLQEMTGISSNTNPYAFVANNSIDKWDGLGLGEFYNLFYFMLFGDLYVDDSDTSTTSVEEQVVDVAEDVVTNTAIDAAESAITSAVISTNPLAQTSPALGFASTVSTVSSGLNVLSSALDRRILANRLIARAMAKRNFDLACKLKKALRDGTPLGPLANQVNALP